jgi:uncharacterized membrane protein YphA (DoxX/SURF4 family)
MNRILKKEVIVECIIFMIVLLFVYAAGSKLKDSNGFIGQMSQSPVIAPYATVLSWAVPSAELVTVIMLFLPKVRIFGLYVAFALMVEFTLYILTILSISDVIPCSCGGILSNLGWREHLFFNVTIVFLIIIAIFQETKRIQNKNQLSRSYVV